MNNYALPRPAEHQAVVVVTFAHGVGRPVTIMEIQRFTGYRLGYLRERLVRLADVGYLRCAFTEDGYHGWECTGRWNPDRREDEGVGS